MTRMTLKDFTFSDGTFVPKGQFISAAMHSMHHDGELYANPDVFNPWRFADLRTQEGEELKHQLVSTNSDYITFGHGKHAWYVISDNWESLEANSLIHLDQLLALDVSLQPMS